MRFLVLGPLEVAEEGGEPLPIAGSKERTILACLIARAGRVVPVDDLIEELWGDHPPRAPEKTLVSYVSRLRRDLQSRRSAGSNEDVIVFRADGYTLDERRSRDRRDQLRAARGRRTPTPRYRAPCRGRSCARGGARSVARRRLPGLPVHGLRRGRRRAARRASTYGHRGPHRLEARRCGIRASSSPSSRPWFERSRSASGAGAS